MAGFDSGTQGPQEDIGILGQKWDARPRPYPYSTNDVFTVVSHAAVADTYGTAVKIISKGTFDFGDSPNQIQIGGLVVESMSDNGVYIVEFLRETTPIGALRFNRTNVQTRSFLYVLDGREVDADTEDVYAQLKTTPANLTLTFSIIVRRHLSTSAFVAASVGTWPTG